MKRLYNLLPLLLVPICFTSPGPHWGTAFSDNKAGIEKPSVGHEEHSDLIVLFSRHAGLASSQSESSSESEAVAEFEERIRSKSNEDILWETFGLMAAMPDAPDDIKQFYGNVLAGEAFAEERRVREALMGWVPGWHYVRVVNKNASLNISKDLVRAAYENRFRERYAELQSAIESMAVGQEQDESRAVFRHICQAYADHGLYFTIVSPERSWPDIVAHLDRYVESTYGKSGDSLRGDYGTFVSEVVPDY